MGSEFKDSGFSRWLFASGCQPATDNQRRLVRDQLSGAVKSTAQRRPQAASEQKPFA